MRVPTKREFIFGKPWSSLLLPRTFGRRKEAAADAAAEAEAAAEDESVPPIRWLTVDFKSTDRAHRLDVDVHAFVFTHEGEYIDCIFYKNPVLAGGSIHLYGSTLYIDLYKIPARAGCIVITLAVYSGGTLVDLEKCATEVMAFIPKTLLLEAAEGVLLEAPQQLPPSMKQQQQKGTCFPTEKDYWAAVLATLEIDAAVTGTSEDAKGMLNCLLAEENGNWFIKALLQPVPAFTPHALMESAEKAAQRFFLEAGMARQEDEHALPLQELLHAALEGKAPVLHRPPGGLLLGKDSQEFEVCTRVSLTEEAGEPDTEIHERRGKEDGSSPQTIAGAAAKAAAERAAATERSRGTHEEEEAIAAREEEGGEEAAVVGAPGGPRRCRPAAARGAYHRRAAAAADDDEDGEALALLGMQQWRYRREDGGDEDEETQEKEEIYMEKEGRKQFAEWRRERQLRLHAFEDEGASTYTRGDGETAAAKEVEEEEEETEEKEEEEEEEERERYGMLQREEKEKKLLQQQQRGLRNSSRVSSPQNNDTAVARRLDMLERSVAGLQQLMETVAAAAADINRKLERRDRLHHQEGLLPRLHRRLKKKGDHVGGQQAAAALAAADGVGPSEEEEEEGEKERKAGPLLAAAAKRLVAAAERAAAAAEREDLERQLRMIEDVIARGERNQQRVAQSLAEVKLQLAGLDQRLLASQGNGFSSAGQPLSPQLVIDEVLVPRQWSRREWQRREGEYPQAAANSLLDPAAAAMNAAAASAHLYYDDEACKDSSSSLLLSDSEGGKTREADNDETGGGGAATATASMRGSPNGRPTAVLSPAAAPARHLSSSLRTLGSRRKGSPGYPAAAGGNVTGGARLTRRGRQLEQWQRRAEAIIHVMDSAETHGEQLGDLLRCLASYTAVDGKKGLDPVETNIFSFAGDARTFAALHSFENAFDRLRDATVKPCGLTTVNYR